MLLDAGADVSAPEGPWGWTSLHLAARNRNPEVARLLLEAGANVNARMFSGLTPLHEAATANPNPAALAVLLQAGADPNALGESSDCAHWDWSGNLTPLYGAARVNRNPEIVEVLVAAGADVDGRGAHMRFACGSSPTAHVPPLYMAVRYDGHPRHDRGAGAGGRGPWSRPTRMGAPSCTGQRSKGLPSFHCSCDWEPTRKHATPRGRRPWTTRGRMSRCSPGSG